MEGDTVEVSTSEGELDDYSTIIPILQTKYNMDVSLHILRLPGMRAKMLHKFMRRGAKQLREVTMIHRFPFYILHMKYLHFHEHCTIPYGR